MHTGTPGTTPPAGGNARQAQPARGSNQTGLRAHNERLVLTLLRSLGPLAKSQIARMTGLSAQTVSVIMRRLEDERLLTRCDPVRGKVGQPTVPMRLAPEGAFFLGLKVGRRSSELVLTDFLGAQRFRHAIAHDYPTPASTVAFARDAIARAEAALDPAERARLAGLGIAMPFQIWEWAQVIGVDPAKMSAWRDCDIAGDLARITGYPAYLRNDASAACGAELVFGTGDTPRDFLYFYIGYFIGGGLVLNGTLHTGPTGNAAVLGPMPVPSPDNPDRQLIDLASLGVLETALRDAGKPARIFREPPERWDVDPQVLATWAQGAAEGMAWATASAASVLDVEAVLIDGWIPASLRDDLVRRTEAALARINTVGLSPLRIAAGTIGPEARALGAASLPLSQRFLLERPSFAVT